MAAADYVEPAFPADAFAGTAEYYARYRVPYPAALTDDLVRRAGVSGHSRLLDLACGPGRVAIPLASLFREVWAVDREPEMLDVGRREAARAGAGNIRWIPGRAEDLEADDGAFELITVGEAFHRLDQWRIARQALRWLGPGRCLATMGFDNILRGSEPWRTLVADVVRKWINLSAAAERDSAAPRPKSGPAHTEAVLAEAGFVDVSSRAFSAPHVWTLDSILGYLYSTSFCSQRRLGAVAADFECDLRRSLLEHDPSGRYPAPLTCGYTLGRKPEAR